MGRRIDLLTSGGDLFEPPITLPTIALSYQRGVGRGGKRRAEAARAAVACTAPPLTIKNLNGILGWKVLCVAEAISGRLLEPVIA
jgi:hypothetical protein